VHCYSLGYLKNDRQRPRFFALIALFSVMILLLVLSSNLLTLFIGWEGVGVASFLLIGYWREKYMAQKASIQAFLANRLGDLAFLIGLLLIGTQAHTLDWAFIIYDNYYVSPIALILLGYGAITKSAQLPMSFWLPGSMEGPTPISALIHAATMVTAGVYLLIRFEPLIAQHQFMQQLLLAVSCVTIVVMSGRACSHRDIKRVIAYSTIAQLGYMVAAVGLLEPELALCHLWTHGFFKALLFLSAGGAIIAADHNQQLSTLSGILRKYPLLQISFTVGLLSLIGFPGFPGFYSKESLIIASHHHLGIIQVSLKIGAVLTALYSGRLLSWIWLCPSPHNPPEYHPIPLSMRSVIAILTLLTILLTPLSLLSAPLFRFPWMPLLQPISWLSVALEPLSICVIISFAGSILYTYYRHRHGTEAFYGPLPEPVFDRATEYCYSWFSRFCLQLKEYGQEYLESFINRSVTTLWHRVSAGVMQGQRLSLRTQMMMLIGLIALGTVLLEGAR
jgi:NADH:ubiquinone oxidoreductase subunit 5 (subunit L)/multisubunit Na+/H+ antiporter MnhA subunit